MASEIQVARLLGIDVANEPQYLWIAQMALKASIDPEEWKEFTNEHGQTMYYNLKLKVPSSHSSCIETFYRKFIQLIL